MSLTPALLLPLVLLGAAAPAATGQERPVDAGELAIEAPSLEAWLAEIGPVEERLAGARLAESLPVENAPSDARPTGSRPDSVNAVDGSHEGAAGGPSPEGEEGTEGEGEQAPQPGGWWHGALGESADNGLYLGLWTLHLKRTHDGISSHRLIGIGWEGIYAKTFVNSFGDRSWGLGVHRSMVSAGSQGAGVTLGLRAGVVRGYDERFHDLAGRWPVMPAAEVVTTARLGRVGIQATWAAVVTSVGAYFPLGSR